jgi:DNA-binding transcriptional ArsR family regulator
VEGDFPTASARGPQEQGQEQEQEQGQGRRVPSWRRSLTPFEVLADPVKVWLIEQLCVGEHSSGDLASLAHESLGIGWSAVSRHLGALRRSGFTDVVVDGPTRWYTLRPDWLDRVEAAVSALREVWDEHESVRGLGFTASLPPSAFRSAVGARHGAPFLDEVQHRPARLRPGRGARDLARRGVGPSEWAEEADGGAGLT